MPPRFLWRVILAGGLLVGGVATGSNLAEAQKTTSDELHRRANTYSKQADSLRLQYEFSSAMTSYNRALSGYRRLGDRTGQGHVHKEIGILHAMQDRYDRALRHMQMSVRFYRAAGDSVGVAKGLNNIAIIHRRRGAYDKALEQYEAALSANHDTDQRADRAVILNNMGLVHENLGQYRKALEKYRAALAMNRELGSREGVATSFDNIGDVLYMQGRYADALEHFRESLTRYRQEGDSADAANSINGIGQIRLAQGNLEAAESRFQSAIRIYRALKDSSSVAANLHNIGAVRLQQDRYPEALSALDEALRINRTIEDRASVAKNLAEIGSVYRACGRQAESTDRYRESLKISRELDRPADVAVAQHGLGLTMLKQGEFATADSLLRGAVRITDKLVQTATGDNRRDFLAKEMTRFQALVTTRVRAGRIDEAIRAYERSRARLLAERLSGQPDSTLSIPPVDSLQKVMGQGEAAVLYANTDTERPILALLVTADSTYAKEIRADRTLERLSDRFDAGLDRLRLQEEVQGSSTPSASVLRQAKGLSVGAEAEGTLANLVRLYHYNVSVPAQRQVLSPERTELLGRFLYDLLVGPIEDDLAAASELVIVPDGALSYLPFGALSGWDGRRLVQRWRVRYVQSLRVLRLLQERDTTDPAQDRRPLLALGGVVYDADSYSSDTSGVGKDGSFSAYSDVRRTSGRGGAGDDEGGALLSGGEETPAAVYGRLGYGRENWRNLTGTLWEVRALADIVEASSLLVGVEARESAITEMSRVGRLDDYRALHFATHGFVVPEEPNLSALVMSEVGLKENGSPEGYDEQRSGDSARADDGYLSMREIADLDIDAEFVGLSACRTGIGRIYRGSGAVSLAHGFLRAGANSVAVSLWSVYDSSTSRFMEAVYRRAWDRDTSWSEAMARTKRAFANGHYGERLRAPRFWAPFVYYGWEDDDRS